jgi:hypothetical protein
MKEKELVISDATHHKQILEGQHPKFVLIMKHTSNSEDSGIVDQHM